jgi:hypothetical protein
MVRISWNPHLAGDRSMLDPFDNPEIAAASSIRGGRSGPDRRIGLKKASNSSTPRVACSRGVRVFTLGGPVQFISAPIFLMGASSRQAPPAITRVAPAGPAGRRMLAT